MSERDEVLRLVLEIEQHCPCGARPEAALTHPHVTGCPVAAAIRLLRAPAEETGQAQREDLGPHPNCQRCKGTGECSNAQFRCPCRWSDSPYRRNAERASTPPVVEPPPRLIAWHTGEPKVGRVKCDHCNGTGMVHSHNPECWDCEGSGWLRPVGPPAAEGAKKGGPLFEAINDALTGGKAHSWDQLADAVEGTADAQELASQLRMAAEMLNPAAEGARPDDVGLSIDMLDADRLRQYAQNLLTYGPDITHWASLPHVVSKLQTIATGIEKAVRDIGLLRAPAEGWQPIASAPKDGTRVLLAPARWTPERAVTAYYRGYMWWIESADARGNVRAFTDPDEDATHWPFTHWQPLPAPPAETGETK